MTLRTLAGLRPSGVSLAMVREPTGSPVRMWCVTMLLRMLWARSSSTTSLIRALRLLALECFECQYTGVIRACQSLQGPGDAGARRLRR